MAAANLKGGSKRRLAINESSWQYNSIHTCVGAFSKPVSYDRLFRPAEIDELAYPMAIGFDIGEANELRMTLQLAVPISIGGGSSSGSGEAAGRRRRRKRR